MSETAQLHTATDVRKEPRTSFHLVHAASGDSAADSLDSSTFLASSRGLGWDGLVAEGGRTPGWEPNDLTFDGHFVAMNLDGKPLALERKGPNGFATELLAPGALWVNPAGASFTQRNLGCAHWCAVEISTNRMRRLLGHDVELRPSFGVKDAPLAAVMLALYAEAESGGSTGTLFADGLATAVASRLARQFAVAAPHRPGVNGIAPRRLKLVRDRIEATIGETITVEDLATIAGLSPAHFAREFKRQTRETPHAFIMRRRLDRAREMLLSGCSIATAASGCGFSDQAHLSRLFKRRFGVTPGALFRRREKF